METINKLTSYSFTAFLFTSLLALNTSFCTSSSPQTAETQRDADTDTIDTHLPDTNNGNFIVNSGVPSIVVKVESGVALPLSLVRLNGFSDEVLVTAQNLPAGVTASQVGFGVNDTSTSIFFLAKADATQGTHTLMLRASGGGVSTTIPIQLEVHGKPGYYDRSLGVKPPTSSGSPTPGFISDDVRINSSLAFYSQSVAVQSDGKILVATTMELQSMMLWKVVVFRYNPDGSRDTDFNKQGPNPGSAIFPHPKTSSGSTIAIQPNGKIVVAASCKEAIESICVWRLNQDGSSDETFGTPTTKGWFNLETTADSYASSIAIAQDGRIAVGGTYFDPTSGLKIMSAVAVFQSNGTPDTTFTVNTPYKISTFRIWDSASGTNMFQEEALHVAWTSEGKLVVLGRTQEGKTGISGRVYESALVKFNSDGSLDNTFGSNGLRRIQLGTTNIITPIDYKNYQHASAFIKNADDQLFVIGTSPLDFVAWIARYLPNGTLDSSFAPNGFVFPLGRRKADLAHSISLQKNGGILYGIQESNTMSLFGRLTAQGNTDFSFGEQGGVTPLSQRIRQIDIQNDGRILTLFDSFAKISIARFWP